MHRGIDFVWRNPRALDAVLAVMTFVAMCLVGGLYQTVYRRFDPLAYVLTGLICLPLAARRIVPMLVLIVVSVGYVVFVAVGYLPGLHLWGPVLAFYSLAAQKPPRVTALGGAGRRCRDCQWPGVVGSAGRRRGPDHGHRRPAAAMSGPGRQPRRLW